MQTQLDYHAMEIHQTVPLTDDSRFSIRLLKLSLNDKLEGQDCQIQGIVAAYTLEAAPPYEALSYVWGKSSKTIDIMLNGMRFAISPALHEALQQLLQDNESAFRTASSLTWIDGICINQHNNKEKSAQVLRMRDIYAHAKRVKVWLGPENEQTVLAFDTLRRFAANDGTIDGRKTYMDIATTKDQRSFAVQDLINRAWFSRVWVVQEVVVAQTATVYCGPHEIDWENVNFGLQRATGSGYTPFNEQVGNVTSIGIWREKFRQKHNSDSRDEDLDLRVLIMDASKKGAADLRDKIYSIRGIASENFGKGITVDYDLSVSRVYIDCTKNLLRMRQDLRVLSLVRYRKKKESFLELPSWVPDWSQGLGGVGGVLNRYYRFLPGRMFQASNGLCSRVTVSNESDIIIIEGVRVDKIKQAFVISDLLCDIGATTLSLSEPLLRSVCERLALRDVYAMTDEPIWLSLFRTITADRSALSPRINNDYRMKNFSHLVSDDLLESKMNRVPSDTALKRVSSSLPEIVEGKVLFLSEGGFLGFTEDGCRPGDDICVLRGGEVPFIIRAADDGHFILHCEAYVHGIMDGEVFCVESEQMLPMEKFSFK